MERATTVKAIKIAMRIYVTISGRRESDRISRIFVANRWTGEQAELKDKSSYEIINVRINIVITY